MKSQGLPFSTIVLAIISILILVLIVFFVTGGFGKIAGITQRYTPTTIQEARTQCRALLTEAQMRIANSLNPAADFPNTDYCKIKFNVTGYNDLLTCYSDAIGIKADFTTTAQNGITYHCYTTDTCVCEEVK